jgi:hypothetical protein
VSPVVVIAGNETVPAAKVDWDVNVGEAIVGDVESTTDPDPVDVVTPVPPLATFRVPDKTTLPDPEAGVNPVVPPLNVVTPEPILNAL